jgi:cob(I)alamin adenosyltransferase
MKVYTKTGDAGVTSLYSGGRVGKDHPRIEAYGTVDELNSLLGLLAAEDLPAGMAEQLAQVQAVLFEIGASLADPEAKLDATPPSWSADPLERWIDAMDVGLEELRAFILPGGTRPAAVAHLARTVCRRAERRVLAVDSVAEGIIPYLNRLSDALFVAARAINARQGVADPEWRRG